MHYECLWCKSPIDESFHLALTLSHLHMQESSVTHSNTLPSRFRAVWRMAAWLLGCDSLVILKREKKRKEFGNYMKDCKQNTMKLLWNQELVEKCIGYDDIFKTRFTVTHYEIIIWIKCLYENSARQYAAKQPSNCNIRYPPSVLPGLWNWWRKHGSVLV